MNKNWMKDDNFAKMKKSKAKRAAERLAFEMQVHGVMSCHNKKKVGAITEKFKDDPAMKDLKAEHFNAPQWLDN